MSLESLASFMTWLGILVGIPNQIYRLNRQKTAKEVSLLNWCIGLISLGIWIPYAIQINNRSLMWADTIGFSLSLIVIIQIIYYRHFKTQSRT